MEDNRKLNAALEYARKGWAVFPVHFPNGNDGCSCHQKSNCEQIGKHPMTLHGHNDASVSEKIILDWWQKSPSANIGIATGKKSGIWVVDIDPKNGGNASFSVLASRISLPRTYTVKSGGGGMHLYFLADPDISLSCRVLMDGIDFKADGGAIVAAPSLHRSGKEYSADNYSLAYMPKQMIEAIQALHGERLRKPSTYWRQILSEGGKKGSRNINITSIAGSLLRRGTDPYLVLELVQSWNLTKGNPPLPQSEVSTIVESLAKAESLRRQRQSGKKV